MTLESGLDNLSNLKDLLRVYEEMGAEEEPELDDLMSIHHSLLGSYEMLLREAPFSESTTDEAKVFLLSDILLIGLDTKGAGKGTRQKRSGTLDKKKKKGTLEIKKGTLTRFKGSYKLLHYLDLRNCTVRDAGTNAEGFCGLQLTHVHRIRVEPARGRGGKKGGTARIVTKVAKLEMWLPTEALKQELQDRFVEALEELDRVNEDLDGETASVGSSRASGTALGAGGAAGRRGSAASSASNGSAAAGGKQRKYVANRARRTTLEKQLSHASGGGDGGASQRGSLAPAPAGLPARAGSLAAGSLGGDSVGGGLQLSDLEQRYKVSLSAAAPGPDDVTDFEVEFAEGRMGLSLGSASGIGVIVGDIAAGGFAEAAGVLISDRVTAVNGVEVGLDDHWQDVLERLKAAPRPLVVRFERFAARTGNLLRQNAALAAHKGPAADGTETAGMSRSKARELGKILNKAHRIVARGQELQPLLAAIADSPDVAGSAPRRSAAAVLDELFRTELAYVRDLRNLVEVYVLPLRNERVKTRCRDMEGAGIMCEHGLRATCRQTARDLQPLVRADDLKGIFLNAETLMFVNVELLRLLENRLNAASDGGRTPLQLDGTVAGFSEAFTAVMPFFKLYADFCHQYASAVDRLLLLRNADAGVNDFIKGIERTQATVPDPERRVQTLSSLLIKPVQRICKYPLLFRELLRHVDARAEGRGALEKAAEEVERIAESVNRHVGESNKFEEFMEVYRGLGGEAAVPDLVTPSRRFVDQVLVTVKEAPFSGAGAPQPRTLFIFNNLLILAKGDGGGTTLARGRSLKRLSLSRTDSQTTAGDSAASGLARTVSRFFTALLGGGGDDDGGGSVGGSSAGRHDSAARKTLKRGRNYKLTHQWDLARCEVKDKRSESGVHTLVLVVKERVLESTSSAARGNADGSQSGTGKVKTEVNRYQLGFDSQEYMDRVDQQLRALMVELRKRVDEDLRGKTQFGNKADYSRRGYTHKTSRMRGVRVGGSDAQERSGAVDEDDDDE